MCKVKMAYLLLCHKDAAQINMFVEQLLAYGDCDVYIHVDKKNKHLIDSIIKDKRVHCFSIYEVMWGSFEIVLAGMYLMQQAVNSNRSYTHIYFGSGQDLLVKKGLYEYLQNSDKAVYIHIKGQVHQRERAAARYMIEWPKRLMIRNDYHIYRYIRIGIQLLHKLGIDVFPNKSQLKNKVAFYEGRTWFVAKIEVIKYITKYVEENSDYVDFWRKSLASDLMFFQTLIMNSQYKDRVAEELMFVKFGTSFGTMNHPLTITSTDIDNIQSGSFYFARKFELENEDAIRYFLAQTRRNYEN